MKGTYNDLSKIKNTINKWQNSDFHPLTCGNDSQYHEILYPQIDLISDTQDLFELTLRCRDCNWKQDIPDLFINEVVEDSFV